MICTITQLLLNQFEHSAVNPVHPVHFPIRRSKVMFVYTLFQTDQNF